MSEDESTIPLSALQHWAYCPRQCGLIHLEQAFDDNVYTLRGHAVHRRVDQPGVETAKGVRVEHALPLWHDGLGLIGKADAVEFDKAGTVLSIVEKPEKPKSSYAVTGIYFLDGDAPRRAKEIKPSPRGELEITDLLNSYRQEGALNVEKLGRGFAWLDTGTHESLLEAALFIRTIEERQNLKVGCPEEIAFENGWISAEKLRELAKPYLKTQYGKYLARIADTVEA